MKTITAIRHVPFEDAGTLGEVLGQSGGTIEYVEAGLHDIGAIDPLASDLLIILGGPIGAYDDDDYPFIRDELNLLERRLAVDLPTLGICLGSQLMARVLGARVYAGEAGKEIGWAPLQLTEAGEAADSPMRHLAPELTSMLHWHGDTFDLPVGAVRLASSDRYANQAFSWGKHGLALQFHPEVTVKGMERWFIGHTGEIAATAGISVQQLRADTQRFGPALEEQGRRFFREWLEGRLA